MGGWHFSPSLPPPNYACGLHNLPREHFARVVFVIYVGSEFRMIRHGMCG